MTRLLSLGGVALGVIVLTTACGSNAPTSIRPLAPTMPASATAGASATPSNSSSPSMPVTPSPSAPRTSTPPTVTHHRTPSAAGTTTNSTTSRVPPPAATTTTTTRRSPVPNVVGLSYAQAKARLDSAGDKFFVLCGGGPGPNGTVTFQDPPGGTTSVWNTLVEVSVKWTSPLDPSSPPGPSSGPIPQKPCPYS